MSQRKKYKKVKSMILKILKKRKTKKRDEL